MITIRLREERKWLLAPKPRRSPSSPEETDNKRRPAPEAVEPSMRSEVDEEENDFLNPLFEVPRTSKSSKHLPTNVKRADELKHLQIWLPIFSKVSKL